ncbi:DMT family transporter [Rhizobium sp. KVB221]|uniref:DMT family transporter n=1 Tax=Rhizobium setariae TaxID=2801340 RepID=A0A936YSX2_9HYPH|nr:DMT family transporter [Rhizobium setariae]MBL0372346.1 DMT family transporter [Rhizobium setariae]
MHPSFKAYIFLLITAFGWAGNAVIAKFAVGHIGPFGLSAARWMLALVLIIAISVPQIRRDWPKIQQYWPLLLGYGAVGFAGFNALLYSALQYTSAINCVIEQAGIPGIIFISNYLLFRMKVSIAQIAGFSLTLLGVGLTATNGSFASIGDLHLNFGDALMLVAAVAYAGYTVSLRWKPDIHWKSLMAATATGAVLASVPLAGVEIASGKFIVPDTIGWIAILYTGTIPSLLSQIFYVRGVELIGPNRAGLFINAVPVFGTLLSVMLLSEQLQPFHIAALAMVLSGIAIAEKGRPRAA